MRLLEVKLSPPILTLLPALALVPVLIGVLLGVHNGGTDIIINCFKAAIYPSLEKIVLQSAWHGLKITISTSIISWTISTFIGILLGFVSSTVCWRTFGYPVSGALFIKRLLAIPRAIHELVWGLLLLQILGLSPWVAIIAITIPYSSLVARVISNQLDTLDRRPLNSLLQAGSGAVAALTTAIIPKIIPVVISYGGYRLECSLRGATLLGIFGMGGIGTDLQLTLQSLEFREMWTALWMLGLVMFLLENLMSLCRGYISKNNISHKEIIGTLATILILFIVSLIELKKQSIGLYTTIAWHPIQFPEYNELLLAYKDLNWLSLISNTILLTLLAAGISIGIPPLGLMIWPTKFGQYIQSLIWSLLRLIPTPLSALILLLCTNPSIYVGALALGAQSIGVMGRLLKEGIDQQSSDKFNALKTSGANKHSAWLYGCMSSQSPSYLAYSAYRTDVLLRETAVVGIIGGTGLGWQIIESITSFHWAQLTLVILIYTLITISGEYLSEYLQGYWSKFNQYKNLGFSLQNT